MSSIVYLSKQRDAPFVEVAMPRSDLSSFEKKPLISPKCKSDGSRLPTQLIKEP